MNTRSLSNDQDSHSVLLGYLMWIFGFFGAHRFYFGKRKSGTLYFFTLGLFGVGWAIDFFLIPSMAKDARRRYYDGQFDYDIAWLLQVFLGPLGLHRFYLGKWLSGLLWLGTGGLFGLGYLYDYWTLNEQISIANQKK